MGKRSSQARKLRRELRKRTGATLQPTARTKMEEDIVSRIESVKARSHEEGVIAGLRMAVETADRSRTIGDCRKKLAASLQSYEEAATIDAIPESAGAA